MSARTGTPEERGLIEWSNSDELSDDNPAATKDTIGADDGKDITYDLPFITPWLKRYNFIHSIIGIKYIVIIIFTFQLDYSLGKGGPFTCLSCLVGPINTT